MTTLHAQIASPIAPPSRWRAPFHLRAWVAFSRLWRWEFWPRTIFYAPLLPWLAWLALRHRGLTVFTAANPAIPHGGVVGESKYDILQRLPQRAIAATELIPIGEPSQRLAALQAVMQRGHWSFPIILKPDVGERGGGVRLVHTLSQAAAVLAEQPHPIVAQTYHPGPFEAGVFYVRRPGDKRGRIFSITDKRFPTVVGDGSRSIEQLVWADKRLRMQADRFAQRLGPRRTSIPARHQVVRLAEAGNHCQGTLFADGSSLWSRRLEARFDRISRAFDGFHFGRFDVRYTDAAAFRRGELDSFAIVELNGVLSESTNIYDPRRSLPGAWLTLARQWSLAFEIGAACARLGAPVTPPAVLWRLLRRHAQRPTRPDHAD